MVQSVGASDASTEINKHKSTNESSPTGEATHAHLIPCPYLDAEAVGDVGLEEGGLALNIRKKALAEAFHEIHFRLGHIALYRRGWSAGLRGGRRLRRVERHTGIVLYCIYCIVDHVTGDGHAETNNSMWASQSTLRL